MYDSRAKGCLLQHTLDLLRIMYIFELMYFAFDVGGAVGRVYRQLSLK